MKQPGVLLSSEQTSWANIYLCTPPREKEKKEKGKKKQAKSAAYMHFNSMTQGVPKITTKISHTNCQITVHPSVNRIAHCICSLISCIHSFINCCPNHCPPICQIESLAAYSFISCIRSFISCCPNHCNAFLMPSHLSNRIACCKCSKISCSSSRCLSYTKEELPCSRSKCP